VNRPLRRLESDEDDRRNATFVVPRSMDITFTVIRVEPKRKEGNVRDNEQRVDEMSSTK